MALPTIRESLYPGATTRIIGHTEMSVGPHNPRDRSRWPGYDQHNPADVLAHCQRLKALGEDILMPNNYAIGSYDDISFNLYLVAMQEVGLNLIVNIDKGLYDGKTNIPVVEIRNYIAYLRKIAFPLPIYEKYQGKYVVTYFVLPTDDPRMFAQIEAENPDVLFVYNDAKMGQSQMAWVQQGLENSLDGWCKTYASRNDGGLYIACASPGFDDTLDGHSAWGGPARVWPAGIGPNAATLQAFFDVINKYWSTSHQLPYLQLCTNNDWNEKTSIEPKADGTGGFFSIPAAPPPPPPPPQPPPPVKPPLPPPVKPAHFELWADGKKIGDILDQAPGKHEVTLVGVSQDGTVKKYPFEVVL